MERWQVMWGLAVLIFFTCKLLTWHEAGRPLSRRALAYWVAWPGLDARTFILNPWGEDEEIQYPGLWDWLFALNKTLLGVILFFGLARHVPPGQNYLTGCVGMVGTVFILHFGTFDLLSCFWRSRGINAEPLMNWPVLCKNLADFWGKRWNTAFRNLTHRFLFRPFQRRFGKKRYAYAILSSFLFSGLIHDAVISLPAGGGYGGPTLYFLLQGCGLLLESRIGRKTLSGWKGRVYAWTFLVLPFPLLFHPPFVNNVMIPFMRAVGALS